MNSLRLLLSSLLKRSKPAKNISGFTMIELLVAVIVAALVIGPLLAFMVNIVDTDRKEQAKSTSEQEVQVALEYIERDLQQAVYIYDAEGINAIRKELPKYDNKAEYFPVLVFWKRKFMSDVIPVVDSTTTDDSFVYSLVAYYLINEGNPTWCNKTPKTNCPARIGRFEVSDGVRDPYTAATSSPPTGRTNCPGYGDTVFIIDKKDNKNKPLCPDNTYQSFGDLLSLPDSIKSKMNKWTKLLGTSYDDTKNPINVLINFVDQTPAASSLQPNCPADMQQIPQYSGSGDSTASDGLKTGSFYACVNADKFVAKVAIRGNALARVQDEATYRNSVAGFFPNGSIQVKGRSFLFSKE